MLSSVKVPDPVLALNTPVGVRVFAVTETAKRQQFIAVCDALRALVSEWCSIALHTLREHKLGYSLPRH